jgi:DNA-binding response OmpR family regulator/HPt (histidine-containing phosphotransfer) domain-containing protein
MAHETMEISGGMAASEWAGLQQLFLEEGVKRSRELLANLDKRFDGAQMAHQMREWAGSAGQLGYHNITELARRAEQLLGDVPVRKPDFRERLSNLLLAFSDLRDRWMAPVPDHVAQALRGKRVALIGLPLEQASRACLALGRVDARPRLFPATDALEFGSIRDCDLVMVFVGLETNGARLQVAVEGSAAGKLLLAGERRHLLALPPAVQLRAADYLVDDWEPEELLLRLMRAISRKATAASVAAATPEVAALEIAAEPRRVTTSPRVLIVDDDPIILTLLRVTLQNYGMECETVNNGGDALRLIRQKKQQVVVLDVNMPGLDGYGVLSTIRAEKLPTLVVLVTARQQEHDVLRGFQLGADDYLVKPFNPLELVARIKRLLRQTSQAAA